MSENPFQTPQVAGKNPTSANKKAPGALTALLIISLILGTFGVFGTCLGGFGLAMQSQLNALTVDGMEEAELEFQNQMQAMQKKQFVPNLLILLVNMVVAPLLCVGAIGGLIKKSWTPGILGVGLLLAAIFVFFRTVVSVFIQIAMKEDVANMMQGIMEQGGNAPEAEIMKTMMSVGIGIGLAASIIWALALIGFYLWGWTYIRKPNIKSYFGAV